MKKLVLIIALTFMVTSFAYAANPNSVGHITTQLTIGQVFQLAISGAIDFGTIGLGSDWDARGVVLAVTTNSAAQWKLKMDFMGVEGKGTANAGKSVAYGQFKLSLEGYNGATLAGTSQFTGSDYVTIPAASNVLLYQTTASPEVGNVQMSLFGRVNIPNEPTNYPEGFYQGIMTITLTET